jgi:hypothetical protein
MRTKPFAFMLSVGILGTGCMAATRPAMVAAPSGEPLAVVEDVVQWTTKEKVQVGEVNYEHSDGSSAGTAKVYENRDKLHSVKIWYPVQGNEQLSDEEFFNIAGDKSALDRTLQLREKGERQQRQGQYVMMGGAVGAVGGAILAYGLGKPAGAWLMYGGGAAVGGGYYWSAMGARMMSKDSHAVERPEAERAAEKYNSQLGRSVGVSGKF